MAPNINFADKVTLNVSSTAHVNHVAKTENRSVADYPGCYWFLQYQKRYDNPSGVVSIHVSKGPIGMTYSVTCHNDNPRGTIDFKTAGKHTVHVTPNYGHSVISVSCNVVFRYETPCSQKGWFMRPYQLIDPCSKQHWDTELVVEEKRLKVHRGFLSMISPVFEAMFRADTKEALTGIVEISDMEYTTVKAAIDFCLGYDMKDRSLEEFIGVHEFVDKYGIVAAISRIEKCIDFKTTVDNLTVVVKYAWHNYHVSLQNQCAKFYYENLEHLAFHSSIITLENDLRTDLVNAAFEFKKSLVEPKPETPEPTKKK